MNYSNCEPLFLNKLVTDGRLKDLDIKDYFFYNYIFPQTWTTANGGFETRNVTGQLKLDQYTHVVNAVFKLSDNTYKSFYGIFFDESFAYYIEETSDRFMHDLHEFKLKCKGEAIRKYLAKC